MDIETDFYSRILEKYSEIKDDLTKIELWKYHSIIELTELSAKSTSKDLIQNGLIIIMALFNNYLLNPYEADSKDNKDLLETERKILSSILIEEFT